MKVVQLFKIYWPDNGGGIAAVMEGISNILRDTADQEIVVCQGKPGRRTAAETYRSVKIRRCRQLFSLASTPFSVSFFASVYRAGRDADLAVYHFPYPMADLTLLGLYRGKYVVWWHCDIDKFKGLLPVYLPLLKRTLKHAERILVTSDRIAEHSPFLQQYRDKCVEMPFGLDGKFMARADEFLRRKSRAGADECMHRKDCAAGRVDADTDAVRCVDRYSCPAQGRVCRILFVGRLVWYKGCDVLLQSLAELEKDGFCYELAVVGDGPLLRELRKLAGELSLSSVHFVGKVTEERKIWFLERCDFLVLPSISKAESFAIVQLEAMAFGKPVINTRIPSGVPSVSVDGETGITVEPGNVEELADAVRCLAENVELREKYGKRAAALVREKYTEVQWKQNFEKLFKELGLLDNVELPKMHYDRK